MAANVIRWATAISSHRDDGTKIVFRYAEAFIPEFRREAQPVRVTFAWSYVSESGQPALEELQQMNQMEDALDAALDEDCATLALVSAGKNLREWTYYSRSEDEFMARLNFALMDSPRYPIEIHIDHDPNWETYEQFRSSVKRETVN